MSTVKNPVFKKNCQDELRVIIATLTKFLPVGDTVCDGTMAVDASMLPVNIRRYCNRRLSKRHGGVRNAPRRPRATVVPVTKRLEYDADGVWHPKNREVVELTFAAIRNQPDAVFVRTPHSDHDVKLFTSKLVVSSASKLLTEKMPPSDVSAHAAIVRVSISITNMCERIVAIANELVAKDIDGVYTDAKIVQQKGTESTGWRVRATQGAGIALNCIAEAHGGLFDAALDELERRFKKVAPIVDDATATTTASSSSSSSDVESDDDESD